MVSYERKSYARLENLLTVASKAGIGVKFSWWIIAIKLGICFSLAPMKKILKIILALIEQKLG